MVSLEEIEDLPRLVGDQALLRAQRIIEDFLPPDSWLMRQFGRFLILLPHGTEIFDHDPLVKSILSVFEQPVPVSGYGSVYLTVRIGVAQNQHDSPISTLVLHEQACYALRIAKKQFSQVVVYHPKHKTSVDQRQQLTQKLRRLICDQGKLLIEHEEIRDLSSGVVVGHEALARLVDEHNQLIPAEEWIHTAGESDLIVPVGRLANTRAILDRYQHGQRLGSTKDGLAQQFLALNFHPRQLKDPRCTGQLMMVLDQHRIDPAEIVIEVTESDRFTDDDITRTLQEMDQLGFRLFLDDFSNHYSCLRPLLDCQIRWSGIKIDRKYIELAEDTDPERSRRGKVFVETLVKQAKEFAPIIVAEVGENPSRSVPFLRELGVQLGQGRYLTSCIWPVRTARSVPG